jgi:CCR4-NOT transcription complex subunit 3
MEKFKQVEKEMKTKAYSKEGLQAQARLDPKDKEKAEFSEFLTNSVAELGEQIEIYEAEAENLLAGQKKNKKDTSKAERVAELERIVERHRFHTKKLELILRTLDNGSIEVDEVKGLEEEIKYYVENNREVDFMENEEMYDELDLQEEEELFAIGQEVDRVSSHDAQSLADDVPDIEPRPGTIGKQKSGSISESTAVPRRPSTQMKSPLPALATLNAPPLPNATNGVSNSGMKPAPIPTRAPGEPLKYASAAAAAAASDQNELGIAPLPPAPSRTTAPSGFSPSPVVANARIVPAASPAVAPQPLRTGSHDSQPLGKSPAPSQASPAVANDEPTPAASQPPEKSEHKARQTPIENKKQLEMERAVEDIGPPSTPALTNGDTHSEVEEEESHYHLPSSLSDLLESFEATKANAADPFSNSASLRLFAAGLNTAPDSVDAERPRHYKPQNPYPYVPSHFPQERLAIFDDPRLYSRLDTDTLFYSFYHLQGSYQQYLAAKALKQQSWRFHKQYQTWFQRHEEPKSITEDYEQGTYRFFDYESTWYVNTPKYLNLNPDPHFLETGISEQISEPLSCTFFA